MKLTRYLGDKPFWQTTARLALPIAIQNMLTSSFQLVDTMMVSQLGDEALSAVGMAGQWGWLALLLGFGICSGMSVFVSQYWGIRDLKGIRRVLGIGLISCLLLTAVFAAAALAAPDFVIRLFNRNEAVVALGRDYLTIACFSYPAVALTNILSAVLRNTERVKLPMYVSFLTTIVNAAANYGLIFGKFGLPEMGIRGAALATCISAWMGPILLLLFSIREKNLLTGPVKELFAFGKENLKAFFRRALPVVANEGMWALGILILNMIYSNMGYEYYAGMTIFKTFADLAFAFYVGLGNACVIMVGKAVGQGQIRSAVRDASRFTVLTSLAGVVVGGTIILFHRQLISLFAAGDNLSELTLQTAAAVTIFCSLEVVLRNIPYVQVVGVFRSGGDTFRGMLYDLGSLWVVGIPCALLAAYVFHLPFLAVVMAAYLGEDIPKSILCLRHFHSRKWLKPVTREGQEGVREYLETEGKKRQKP